MKADDCSFRCSALAQFGLNADIPRLSKPFRKDELAACLAKITA